MAERSVNQTWDKHLREEPLSSKKEKQDRGIRSEQEDLRLVPK